MGYQINYDPRNHRKELSGFIDGVFDLLKQSKKVTFPTKTAGEIAIKILVLDDEVTTFSKYCGEQGETVVADYWGLKALAYGMAGRVREGEAYYKKSRERREGGAIAEWNQTYYK